MKNFCLPTQKNKKKKKKNLQSYHKMVLGRLTQ